MKLSPEKIYLSTIDENAQSLARAHGYGLEIAEYCTAYNMDEHFEQVDALVQAKMQGIERFTLHGPFNELFPCAIDPKIRAVATERYRQAIAVAKHYRITKLILHAGYNPRLYYPCWFTEQSILFWKAFVHEIPEGMTICLENVLEEEPEMLLEIVRAVNDTRLRLCLDIGHVNAYSHLSVPEWLQRCGESIAHLHIHNNDGTQDQHQSLNQGSIPMEEVLCLIAKTCPKASCTLELMDAKASLYWLQDR